MATTMKAAVVRAFGQPLVVEDVPIPVPGPGELLVRVLACGVCHTDLHAADGDWPVKPVPPFIPGHEIAGVVAALGPGVSDFVPGDAVGVAWLHDSCLRCEYCETGWETLCEHQHNTGYSCNGGFAEYAIATAAFAARLPAGVDFAAIAPILCAGVTTYKGLKETEARPGEWVAISGIGGLGQVAIQYAKAMGLKVVALDIAAEKLALARETGADVVIDARSPSAIDDVVAATGGGAQGVLVTAVSPPAFAQAVRMGRRKGTVVLVGLPPGEFPTPIFDVVLKRITLRGSIVGTRRDLDEAIAFAAEGKVTARIATAPLGDINRIFERLKQGAIEGRMVLDLSLPITSMAPARGAAGGRAAA
ncbi:alcohol dehydrogenase AdhP [Bosea sp. (in: a-proteobacteria)]|uniref:alcohol dehydrogenase AdhP n=1 Tax=Bosea sp. (in: a-proteobacteria) TaxID=1871050 RepID=UPI00273472DF|nr:alcohol dehydrogenase AdhP [Bosea sp. (in: a-proteobacteria)]MDP3410455.1 alcohol dehydrogenase AdhP [Bosea sp. (in: a-proteobacteria)]